MLRIESPFPDWAAPAVWVWTKEFRSRVADDFGPKTLEEFMADWTARSDRVRSWAVYRGSELGGLVTFEPWSPMVGTTHCLFKRTFWGHDTTLEALRMVYDAIFRETGVNKLTAFCFADNYQLVGIARRLGARKEGLLRQQTVRQGKPVDMIAIGLLREDFYELHGASVSEDRHGDDPRPEGRKGGGPGSGDVGRERPDGSVGQPGRDGHIEAVGHEQAEFAQP